MDKSPHQLRNEILDYGLDELSKDIVPIRDTIDVLSQKWKVEVLTSIVLGNKRFKEIRSLLPDVSDKVLSSRLATMVEEKLILRKDMGDFAEYLPTEHGVKLYNVINRMRDWGKEHRRLCIGDFDLPGGK